MCIITKFIDENCNFEIRGIKEVSFTPFTPKRILNRVGDKWTIDTIHPWVRFYFNDKIGTFTEQAVFDKNNYYLKVDLSLNFSKLTYYNNEALKPFLDMMVMAYVVTEEDTVWLLGAENGLRLDKYFSSPGSKTNGFNGYELNWTGTGLGQVLELNVVPPPDPNRQTKHYTFHYRGESKYEIVTITDTNISNLLIYDTLNGGEMQNELTFEYVEGEGGIDCLAVIPEERLTYEELIAKLYGRNVSFSLIIRLENYDNLQQDAAILLTYDTDGIAPATQTFSFDFDVNAVSKDTLVGFHNNINVTSFNFNKYRVGMRADYSSNFTEFNISTLTALNTAIDDMFTNNNGYYTLHIFIIDNNESNITFEFTYE